MHFQTQKTYEDIFTDSKNVSLFISNPSFAGVYIILHIHGAVKHSLIFLAELHTKKIDALRAQARRYLFLNLFSALSSFFLFPFLALSLSRVRVRYIAGISRFFLLFSVPLGKGKNYPRTFTSRMRIPHQERREQWTHCSNVIIRAEWNFVQQPSLLVLVF